jgi:hypothetical protein
MSELNARMEALVAAGKVPPRVARLPVSPSGFFVPWFVWFNDDGVPDFRVIAPGKVGKAYRERRCWVCGERTGRHLSFIAGPMCAINRTSAEPPSHHDCAIFAATACPFLSQPKMRRNDKGLPEERSYNEGAIDRNPGVSMVWTTDSYKPFQVGRTDGKTGYLFTMGEPTEVLWFCRGRPADRMEVMESVESGMPLLREPARFEGRAAEAELDRLYRQFLKFLPEGNRPPEPVTA